MNTYQRDGIHLTTQHVLIFLIQSTSVNQKAIDLFAVFAHSFEQVNFFEQTSHTFFCANCFLCMHFHFTYNSFKWSHKRTKRQQQQLNLFPLSSRVPQTRTQYFYPSSNTSPF